MTILQSYRCKACHFGFGPIAVQPFVPSRPQVFRYCTDCKAGQSLIVTDATQPLSCVHCRSTKLLDVQRQCPICASTNVGWESRLP